MTDGEIVEGVLKATEHLSQTEAAELIGVSQKTVSTWRGGARPALQPTRRQRLLEFLENTKGAGGARRRAHPSDDDEWRIEMDAAANRARALAELATAERVHAEASKIREEASKLRAEAEKIRAEAIAGQGRAAENDSDRAAARSRMGAEHQLRALFGDEAPSILAAIRDLAEARRTARGEAGKSPPGEQDVA